MLQMHAGLRLSRAARRVKPECRVILAGNGGLQFIGAALQQIVESQHPRGSFALHHNRFEITQLLARDRLHQRKQGIPDDRDPRPRIVEQILVVLRLEQSVDGHSNRADLDRPKE